MKPENQTEQVSCLFNCTPQEREKLEELSQEDNRMVNGYCKVVLLTHIRKHLKQKSTNPKTKTAHEKKSSR
jgi:hypothetical protein